jgi:hypothetical protein
MRIGLLSSNVLYPLAGTAGVAENVHSSAANVQINEDIAVQTDLYIRAANARHYDRANLAAEITFDTVRTFATVEAAEAWAMDYSETYPRTGTLIIDSSERLGYASQIVVSGTLTSDGSTPVTLGTLPFDSIVNSRPKFKNAGLDTCSWSGTYWALVDNATGAAWRSADDVASPELCTTWVPQGAATGTPAIAATYPARRYMSNAIVHPPSRSIMGVAVMLSYRVTGAAIETTQADADTAWQDLITFPGENWED